MAKTKILVVVEGQKAEPTILEHLLNLYGIDCYDIISYNANIYDLYYEIDSISYMDFEDIDIVQILKSREKDSYKRQKLEYNFSDIILIFDFDPQDNKFDYNKIHKLQKYFVESTDMGKLYINFPMVESFFHMSSIPDSNYLNRKVSAEIIKAKKYKEVVDRESKSKNCKHYVSDVTLSNKVIEANIEKAIFIQNDLKKADILPKNLNLCLLLEKQNCFLSNKNFVYVLCTMLFFILDYNSEYVYKAKRD
ncbi:hypothetical protein [Enterococcus rivorum]|uniref:hypothetical protein n=1 Tax=Enterococcus rivorum TaxID=762845 RepID=UPI001112E59C|nr:hypothetical protein [Enterococcus rivorum]MBP2098046.1 hypothetical protein [Enterococcus rivorum]